MIYGHTNTAKTMTGSRTHLPFFPPPLYGRALLRGTSSMSTRLTLDVHMVDGAQGLPFSIFYQWRVETSQVPQETAFPNGPNNDGIDTDSMARAAATC